MSGRDAILARFAVRAISPEIALAQLLLTGEVPDPAALPAPLADLARTHAARLPGLAALARDGFDPDGADPVATTAALFDRLATVAPEAAVAFYSLGDPALLTAATAELVAVICRWTAVKDATLLDFGCGIGRVALAVAPLAREVVGVDLSVAMVAEARARAAGIANARFQTSDGGALPFEAAGFDVILAVDSLPFLVPAGPEAVDRQFAEFSRLLRPGGDLLLFNWSYRGDPAQDEAEAAEMAARHGFDLRRAGERPFVIWDGAGFQLRRRP